MKYIKLINPVVIPNYKKFDRRYKYLCPLTAGSDSNIFIPACGDHHYCLHMTTGKNTI